MAFAESYLGRLRALVGSRLLLVPGTRIIIERDDSRVLLQLRSDFGVWGIPGGGPEEGESIGEAIVREVLEETGLTIRDPQPFGYACNPGVETVQFPNGDCCQFFSLMFFTHRFEGILKIDDGESLALDWFDPHHLPEMLPNMRRSVEAYLQFKATGVFQLI
jgi:8-oxo-dGTP pyrophosphatase MutT (NUDIX family)